MTNAALRGKPYAGNPHVRFDEGEVASAATPRRGSLLYRARIIAVSTVVTVILPFACGAECDQGGLERYLVLCKPYCSSGDEPYVLPRYRDALADSKDFFESSGWTTNQFIEGLMCAMTNNITDRNWSDEYKRDAAGVAAWKLGEIDNPAVTNFFRQFNDSDDTDKLKIETIPPMFWRTNLEPEVLAYMRSLCVRTNVYCKVEYDVMRDMFETLSTMSDELKPAATNRVAQFMYFAVRHVTDSQGLQDIELSRFIPAYSNSWQRLSLMRYVSTSATNDWERSNAAQIVQRLESMPTNQLNDVSWIEQGE